MARTWLSVKVELLGGRGEELWPWPGRVFAVGPSHTFADLADAINGAFARWDLAHLSLFTLSDGRIITDPETGIEMAESIDGPVGESLNLETTTVARTVGPRAEIKFTFDLGDNWVHRCVVEEEKIDPLATLGESPRTPLPYWGWGSIPDQYGRRSDDDDGTGRVPKRPARHPMLQVAWPEAEGEEVPEFDLAEVRGAVARGDAEVFLDAVIGRDIDDALQQVAAGLPMALEQRRDRAEQLTLSVISRLTGRSGPGDDILAEDLLARLRGEPMPGRVIPVDLDMLSSQLEGDPSMSTGGYLDLRSGEVYPEDAADPMMVGEDAAIDLDDDPDRWLPVDRACSDDGWTDMAAFAQRQHDAQLRERLERAIEGRGAFRRFRDAVREEGLAQQWYAYSTDRQMGRAREFLAGEGIRVG